MIPLLVFVAVLAVYVQSLGGTLLWDDRWLVVDVPLVERGGSLAEYFSAPFWTGASREGGISYYRPFVTLSFAIDHRLHAGNPAGYHLTNVAFHTLNALLVYALARKLGTRKPTAGLVAIGWALLPRLAEAGAWISGRTDLIAATFTFSALLAWGPGLARRSAAALLVGMGLLAKESAIAGAFAIAASTWVASAPGPLKKRATGVLVELMPLGVVVVAYSILRLAVFGYPGAGAELGVAQRIATVLEALGTYAAMLVDAWRPRAVIGRVGSPSVAGIAAGVAVLASSAWLFRRRAHFDPKGALGVALFAGALLPVLHLVPIPLLTLTADRFLYLPAAGLALAIAPWVDARLGARRGPWLVAVALVGSLAFVTFRRVALWSDELEFWIQTYLETPATNSAGAKELAAVYYRAGLYREALVLARRALDDYESRGGKNGRYDVALCLSQLGRLDAARDMLAPLRGKGRRSNDVELEIARIELRSGNEAEARAILERLVKAGYAPAERALAGLPRFAAARRELAQLDASSPPELRARLATLLEDDGVAVPTWSLVAETATSKAAIERALVFLVRRGDRDSIARAASTHLARFGPIDRGLKVQVDARLAELDRLLAARSRVRL
jgi:tetratricopeptide (TPR) repeat protein